MGNLPAYARLQGSAVRLPVHFDDGTLSAVATHSSVLIFIANCMFALLTYASRRFQGKDCQPHVWITG
jgi:hypothetical protein